MRIPSTNLITLPFGATSAPYSSVSPHNGTDFAYTPDEHIYAPFSGRVTQRPNNGNDGNGTYMTDSEGRLHGMLHAASYLVPNGSDVYEGQPIAIIGDTGYAFGRHLHYCVKVNNKFIDPMSLMEEPMYNEGDRVNDNVYLYGKDMGYFKAMVGKDWKTAHQMIFSPDSEFDFEYKVNEGDVKNYNTMFKIGNAGNLFKQTHKKFSYWLPDQLPKDGKFKKLDEDVYVEVK